MATKICPFCKEEIQAEAIKCRYCLSSLEPPPLPAIKAWEYAITIFHFRNMDESGWLNAENTPAAQAAQHFWNEFQSLIISLDEEMVNNGWEILEPHGPGSFKIESIRNAKGQNGLLVGLSAALTMGASLITSAVGFYKWWTSSLTLRYKRLSDENSEDVAHFWMDPSNNYEWVLTKELK